MHFINDDAGDSKKKSEKIVSFNVRYHSGRYH